MAAPTFFLWRIRETILEGRLLEWRDADLSVLAVLLAHENHKTRVSCPSTARIAALGGLSKSSVRPALINITSEGWLTSQVVPSKGGLGFRALYHMKYVPWKEGDTSRRWLHVDSGLVYNGLWAAMSPDVRRLYLTVLSLAWAGDFADISTDEDGDTSAWFHREGAGGHSFRFLDAVYAGPRRLRELANISPRSFSRSINWLVDNRLLQPNEEGVVMPNGEVLAHQNGVCREGLIIPDVSCLCVRNVLERVAKVKAENDKASAQGKRLITRTSKRMRQAGSKPRTSSLMVKTDPPILRTGEAQQSDRSVLELVFEPVSELPF